MRLRPLVETKVFKVDPKDPDAAAIEFGARVIRGGGLVVFPTETVYGIAANLLNQKTVDRLYEVKRRFRGKPFTVHIADLKAIREMGCAISKKARLAIDKYWPGPLTVILQAKDGRKTGFRMPANEVALRLISAARVPVVAPSANISGKKPPRDAKSALRDLDKRVDVVIDAGRTAVGVESTVVDFTTDPPAILREGAVTRTALMRTLKG